MNLQETHKYQQPASGQRVRVHPTVLRPQCTLSVGNHGLTVDC